LHPAAGPSTRRSICWSGDWPGTVCWSTASGAHAAPRTGSSSSRRLPIIGRRRRSCATPTFSPCLGSPTCDGAPTRWCWNHRAPAPCSKFTIRRSRPSWPCCPHRNKSNCSVGGSISRDRASRPARRLPDPFQDWRCRRRWPAADRGRRQLGSLGLSRSSVPCAQHRRPARQPAGRTLWICGRHASASGGTSALAGKEDRFARVLGRASAGNLADRKAPA